MRPSGGIVGSAAGQPANVSAIPKLIAVVKTEIGRHLRLHHLAAASNGSVIFQTPATRNTSRQQDCGNNTQHSLPRRKIQGSGLLRSLCNTVIHAYHFSPLFPRRTVGDPSHLFDCMEFARAACRLSSSTTLRIYTGNPKQPRATAIAVRGADYLMSVTTRHAMLGPRRAAST